MTEPIGIVEKVEWQGRPLMYVLRAEATSPETAFVTPDDFNFQMGFVVYPAGGEVKPHVHNPVDRQIVGTSEALLVRQGSCMVDVYSDDRQYVSSVKLEKGDLLLMIGGGHGFRMLEDTILLEIKQGPYGGEGEKERFDPKPDQTPR